MPTRWMAWTRRSWRARKGHRAPRDRSGLRVRKGLQDPSVPRVRRARRAYVAKEARSVHRDLLAPPEFQLRLSVRRLTCV